MDEQTQMQLYIDQLNQWNVEYYEQDQPSVSDSEWDALYARLQKIEKSTGMILAGSPTQRIGGSPITAFESHVHHQRLWSLDKAKTLDELRDWTKRIQKRCDAYRQETGIALPSLCYTLEYKFDGLTVNLTYENGNLIQAATRGNGVQGEVVLEQIKTIKRLPLQIPFDGFIEVQGECIMRLSILADYNQQHPEEPLKNARNAAAGALRNLDPKITASRNLDVWLYGIGEYSGEDIQSQEDAMKFLEMNHFPIQRLLGVYDAIELLIADIDAIEETRETLDFLIDGLVIKIDDYQTREILGYTDKFPRWAIAYKFEAQEAITTIRQITWEVGRTGKLTPLAHLDPVQIGGVQVQRATLNNYGDIQRKGVFEGAEVFIRRSNDVIPEIRGTVQNQTMIKTVEKPTICPFCGMPLEEKGALLYCTNVFLCSPQIVGSLAHFASRDAMNIEMFSEKTAQLFVEKLEMKSFVDLYRLTEEDLFNLEGFGPKKIKNLLEEIETSKQCSLSAFIFALGIPNVGSKTARELASCFGSLDALSQATTEELLVIDDIGPIIAKDICAFFKHETMAKQVQELLALGVQPVVADRDVTSNSVFAGKTVVLTGTLEQMDRKQTTQLIEAYGGKVTGAVSKKTDYVIVGSNAGSKEKKAQELNIPILNEAELQMMLGSE